MSNDLKPPVEQHEAAPADLIAKARLLAAAVIEYPDFDCDNPDDPRPLCKIAKDVIAAIEQNAAPLEGTGNGADERAPLADDMVDYLYDLARGYTKEKFAKNLQSLFGARAPRTDVARAAPIAMETRDTKDARYFRWLCAHPDWHFIEALCQQFVAESQVEFYTKLSAEIEKRIKHGANKGKKRLPNGSLAFPEAVAAAPQSPSADAAAAPADERAAFEAWWFEREAFGLRVERLDTPEVAARAAWNERAAASQPAALAEHSYASKQATNCAKCGQHKHTPLRIDWMGGYVCLTCIDKELEARDPAAGQEAVAWETTHPAVCTPITKEPLVAAGWREQGWHVFQLYTAPPAQVATRQGLTERQRMDLLLVADDMSATGDAKLADALRALLEGAKHA